MNVNDIVAEKIAAAARRAEEAKRRRAALSANRQRGLALRHAAKLARQASAGQTDGTESDTPSPSTAGFNVTPASPTDGPANDTTKESQ